MVAQSAAKGALPSLYAATSHAVEGGEYYGPSGFYEAFGYPGKASSTRRSQNPQIGERLWAVSESLTGIHYDFQAARSTRTA